MDTDTSYHAVQAVAQFAADERYRAVVAAEPGVVELTALLSSHSQHVQQCALSAIANVSFVPSVVTPLADSGALAHLGVLLFNKEEQVGTPLSLCTYLRPRSPSPPDDTQHMPLNSSTRI